MKISRLHKLIFATICCLVLVPVGQAQPGNGNSGHGTGNSAFGRSQAMDPSVGRANSDFGRATSKEAKRKRKSKSRKEMQSRGTRHGNAAFGHRQGDATTRTTGRQNNAYGQRTAATHRSSEADRGKSADTGTKASGNAAPGNSAFGHRQGDATTRTTGSQNNAHGKAQSSAAHAKHNPDDESTGVTPAPSPGE